MKKSMLNVITLTLVLINLVLTVVLTFSLVSTTQKTNNLVTKISSIIDLDIAGDTTASNTANSSSDVSIDNLETIEITNGDETKITISVLGNDGKTHYAVVNAVFTLNTKSKDYEKKKPTITNSMKLIVSEVYNVVSTYQYDQVNNNKTNIENTLLVNLQDLFQTDAIYSVRIASIVVQ